MTISKETRRERNKKRAYLKNYKALCNKAEYLTNDIQGLKSIDFNHVKSTNRKTLSDKIDELDNIKKQMHDIRVVIDHADLPYSTVLGYKYLLFKSNDYIANKWT